MTFESPSAILLRQHFPTRPSPPLPIGMADFHQTSRHGLDESDASLATSPLFASLTRSHNQVAKERPEPLVNHRQDRNSDDHA